MCIVPLIEHNGWNPNHAAVLKNCSPKRNRDWGKVWSMSLSLLDLRHIHGNSLSTLLRSRVPSMYWTDARISSLFSLTCFSNSSMTFVIKSSGLILFQPGLRTNVSPVFRLWLHQLFRYSLCTSHGHCPGSLMKYFSSSCWFYRCNKTSWIMSIPHKSQVDSCILCMKLILYQNLLQKQCELIKHIVPK